MPLHKKSLLFRVLKTKHFPVIAFILICTSFLFCPSISAQTIHVLTDFKEPIRIGQSFEFYTDSSNSLSLSEVFERGKFKSTQKAVPAFETDATVFGRICFTSTISRDFYIKMDPLMMERLLVFQKVGTGEWKKTKAGILMQGSERDFSMGSFFFRLHVIKDDTTTFVLKFRPVMPVNLDITVGSSDTFYNKFHSTDLFNGICIGIILMMFIYNLFLYVSQRDREYLWYLLYLLATLIILPFAVLGYSAHYPQFILSIYENSSSWYTVSPLIFLMLFIMELFRGIIPRWLMIINYSFISLSLTALVSGTLGFEKLSFQLVTIQNMLIIIPSLLVGIIALRKKHSSAVYYLIGFGVLLVGLSAFMSSLTGAAPFDLMDGIRVHTAGTAFESIMLSFAVGNKLKVSQKQKQEAQYRFLEQSRENERLIKEQNAILEQRVEERTKQLSEVNDELNHQNVQISAQKDEIELQRHIAEERRQEILDSITYAKRIQQAMLPPMELILEKLPETFILYKPKDIVAGDFYWMEENEDTLFIAAADCTGHGVPGAMVSVVCSNALNRAVKEFKLKEPGLILDKVTDLVVETFEKSSEDVKDGMDISLMAIPKMSKEQKVNQLHWSGANNPLWYIEQGEMKKITADKQPIGKSDHRKSFTTHQVNYESGTTFFLLTDGYADQFGGTKGKKFKHKQLEALLQLVYTKSPMEQTAALDVAFEDWRGELEQVDDVTVIGIRL